MHHGSASATRVDRFFYPLPGRLIMQQFSAASLGRLRFLMMAPTCFIVHNRFDKVPRASPPAHTNAAAHRDNL